METVTSQLVLNPIPSPVFEGVKFHVSGAEFISILERRVAEHLAKADEAEASMHTAAEAMETARAAAAKAGPSGRGGGQLEAMSFGATRSVTASRSRSYGGSIEDPVGALREAVVHHRQRATALSFYAKHLLAGVTYVLSQNEIQQYELLDEVTFGSDDNFEE